MVEGVKSENAEKSRQGPESEIKRKRKNIDSDTKKHVKFSSLKVCQILNSESVTKQTCWYIRYYLIGS